MISVYIMIVVIFNLLLGLLGQYVNLYALNKRPDIVDRFQYTYKQQEKSLDVFRNESSSRFNSLIYLVMKLDTKIKMYHYFLGLVIVFFLNLVI